MPAPSNDTFEGMGAVARWFARPLLMFLADQRATRESSAENAAVEGLNLVLARFRRTMHEQQIERIDVLGRAFDGETMNAIGMAESADYPSGHVAEQISPCYRWRGQLLHYADVRVAK